MLLTAGEPELSHANVSQQSADFNRVHILSGQIWSYRSESHFLLLGQQKSLLSLSMSVKTAY